MAKTKIIIADEQSLVRLGIKRLIRCDPAFIIVGEAASGRELFNLLKNKTCDFLIIDIAMAQIDGLTVLKEVRKRYPALKILILTMLYDYWHFHQAMILGVAGYMVKDDDPGQLITAMKTILKGRQYLSPAVMTMPVEGESRSLDQAIPSLEILTTREKQILSMLAQGFSNREIAAKNKISIRTVEHHHGNLAKKLGLKDSASLVKYALIKGLISIPQ